MNLDYESIYLIHHRHVGQNREDMDLLDDIDHDHLMQILLDNYPVHRLRTWVLLDGSDMKSLDLV